MARYYLQTTRGQGTTPTPRGSSSDPALLADIVAHASDVQQVIDGFGASDRNSGSLSTAEADLFFSSTPGTGIGLSILRSSIDTDGTYVGDIQNAVKAAARGAIVVAAPWSPPAAWKDNGSTTNGGHLLVAHYTDMANQLASFKATLNAVGVSLYGMGMQNEPDFTASYDSCLYSTSEMVAFIKVAGPILHALTPPVKVIAAEPSGWNSLFPSYSNAIVADTTAFNQTDIFAAHQYDLTFPETPSQYVVGARKIWETEWSTFDPPDGSIANGLRTASLIHRSMLINVNAWLYWDLTGNQFTTDNEGLMGFYDVLNGGPGPRVKRLYCMGNYSLFIRPGYNRIGTTGSVSGILASAYRLSSTGAFVFVAINTNATSTTFSFSIVGASLPVVTPYVTSASQNLAAQSAINQSAAIFPVTLPANSVTSFVGMAS